MGVSTGNLLSEMMNFFVWLLPNLHVLVVNKYIFLLKHFILSPKIAWEENKAPVCFECQTFLIKIYNEFTTVV